MLNIEEISERKDSLMKRLLRGLCALLLMTLLLPTALAAKATPTPPAGRDFH